MSLMSITYLAYFITTVLKLFVAFNSDIPGTSLHTSTKIMELPFILKLLAYLGAPKLSTRLNLSISF